MITAVGDARLHHRQNSKSANAGPEFEIPLLVNVGDLMATAQAAAAVPACTAVPAPTPTASTDLSGYVGRSVGSGQCVALVRAALPSLGPASTWTAGAPVQGNTTLAPGTPIATFDPANRYANALDGSSHAAIYLGQNTQGVQVLDQWAGSAAAIRTIPWSHPGATAANTGTAFKVVLPTPA